MQSTLTRIQFDGACKALVEKYSAVNLETKGLKGWHWTEHPSLSGFGYLSRNVLLVRRRNPIDGMNDEELQAPKDDAVYSIQDPSHELLNCCQNIVYSPTFRVPAFYFTVHDSNGSPLSLDDLIQTSLFKAFAFDGTELTKFALSLPGAPFPLLSQGDHPTTGRPSWYLHPCETSSAVGEVIREVREADRSEEAALVRWMETWIMVVGTVIDWKE